MNEKTLALAIRIAAALQDGDAPALTPAPAKHHLIGKRVLVRDHKAGVYCGVLTAMDVEAGTAELRDARQVWYWTGAAATPGIAARGVGEGSKIGPKVEAVVCCDVVQVMPMTSQAWESVMGAPEWMGAGND